MSYFPKKENFEKIDINSINQLEVWRYILGINVDIGDKFTNPYRADDKTPNCTLKLYNGNIVFYDKPGAILHAKTCFSAWMEINNVNFSEALNQISKKIPLNNIKKTTIVKPKTNAIIVPHIKLWSKAGLKWWADYGITDLENIFEIEGYELNDQLCIISRLGFAYLYNKNINNELLPTQNWKWKIYLPKCIINGEEFKSNWLSNVTKELTWFKDNRNKIGNTNKLIFSKSAKCQLVHESLLGNSFSYLHPQGEILNRSYPHINLLKEFNEVILFFDNDSVGKLCSNRFYEILTKKGVNCKQVFTKNQKDISDMRKEVGANKVKQFYKEIGLY